MTKKLRLAIAQINSTVGDLDGNYRKIDNSIQKARGMGVDIISFPELAMTGYPPEDLLLKNGFIQDNLLKINKLAKSVNGIVAIVGFVDKKGNDIYNAAAVIYNGEIVGTYHKCFLPNYGVFDEKRYFKPGNNPLVFKYGDFVFGVNVCEDIWHAEGPTKLQASYGARLIVNVNSSPYYAGKTKEREDMVLGQAKANNVFLSYANMVGGQDELVFDGQSMVIDNNGRIMAMAEAFKEDLIVIDIDIPAGRISLSKNAITIADKIPARAKTEISAKEMKPMDPIAEIYAALKLGLADYAAKNGFKKVVIGLSGGVDSALVATLATDALGKDNVVGVFMPSHYSSLESENDAKELASNLGITYFDIPIENIFKLYLMTLEPHFAGKARDITEENMQARIRGNILMALSNKFGWLALTTGNKSEMSTGYATLYGDMAGGFALIKDVPKTLVYKLVKYRNSLNRVVPQSIITKEPTAELRPDQKDRDTLPPYDILDKILKKYIEEDEGLDDILASGIDKETALKVLKMVDKSEYKRRQSPPGIKITPKAFGKDRRMPITNRYRG